MRARSLLTGLCCIQGDGENEDGGFGELIMSVLTIGERASGVSTRATAKRADAAATSSRPQAVTCDSFSDALHARDYIEDLACPYLRGSRSSAENAQAESSHRLIESLHRWSSQTSASLNLSEAQSAGPQSFRNRRATQSKPRAELQFIASPTEKRETLRLSSSRY
jgi:hypothetical protein